MTEPRYVDGWICQEQFGPVAEKMIATYGDGVVSYRSIMRRTDGKVWVAPIGTPDPWLAEDADHWVAL